MTGPEHYREAERLVEDAKQATTDEPIREYLAAAQVHATLALADATSHAIAILGELSVRDDVRGGE